MELIVNVSKNILNSSFFFFLIVCIINLFAWVLFVFIVLKFHTHFG